MKRILFYILYLASVAIPVTLYVRALGNTLDSYTLSVALGVAAYTMICNQFILASKPAYIMGSLGAQGALSLHKIAPLFIIVMAGVHQNLKEQNGLELTGVQPTLGAIALVIIIFLSLFAILFMANTALSRVGALARLKKWGYSKWGLTYKGARALHNALAIAGILVLLHALLASSSSFESNPIGVIWMILWMALSLGLYLRYRISGRNRANVSFKDGAPNSPHIHEGE